MKKVKKGTEVIVKHILGETAQNLLVPLRNNSYQSVCDAYVIGETCKAGFFYLRQARAVIPGKKLQTTRITYWPKLRKALHELGYSTVNIPGGGCPIHYKFEIVVPDFGSNYYVVNKFFIPSVLKAASLKK